MEPFQLASAPDLEAGSSHNHKHKPHHDGHHHHHHQKGAEGQHKAKPKPPPPAKPKPQQLGQNNQLRANSFARHASRMGERTMKTMTKVGGAVNQNRHQMLRNAEARRRMMETSLRQMEHNSNPQDPKLKRMQTFVRKQVEQRQNNAHPPYFTCFATIMQLALLVAMLYYGPIASWGLGVTDKTYEVNLFVGTGNQQVKRPQNPYYGPEVETLVSWGSKWAPCMRKEQDVEKYQQDSVDNEKDFGCCVNSALECGMMDESTCNSFSGTTFTAVGQNCSSTPACTTIKLRPCCYGIYGQCAVLAEQHCNVLDGIWADDEEVCANNDCIYRQCGMGYEYVDWTPNNDQQPNQFYRFVTANFLHVGVVHFVFNALGQYVLVSQVELIAGFWRTAAMYVMSGSCGFMFSAIFSAKLLSNGSSAAIYGMLGVEAVDMFQSWQLYDNPCAALVPLTIKLILFLGIGTLPYIDNFAHVGGFLAGIVSGLIFLPYIVFGTFDGFRKGFTQVASVIGIMVVTITMLAVFYTKSEVGCDGCKYINCVPYKSGMCDYGQSDVKN